MEEECQDFCQVSQTNLPHLSCINSDSCQDSLSEDDVMLLDTGKEVSNRNIQSSNLHHMTGIHMGWPGS